MADRRRTAKDEVCRFFGAPLAVDRVEGAKSRANRIFGTCNHGRGTANALCLSLELFIHHCLAESKLDRLEYGTIL